MITTMVALAAIAATPARYVVRWKGEMRRVMRDGDLTDRVNLDDFARMPHLYAIGPVSGLRGEITLFDSVPSIARVGRAKPLPVVTSEFEVKAPFLVWVQVERWQKVPIAKPLADLAALERLVQAEAKRAGLDVSKPIPFRVRGTVVSGSYHVVNRKGNARPSHAEHARIQVKYPLRNARVEALGFWSDRHHGVWTHHGENVHVHLRTEDGKGSGHGDFLRFAAGATLWLPAD